MDRFPLPRIEQMVDATVRYARLSFVDAYRGYHLIAVAKEDREKLAFITPWGTFCYNIVPFGLKNVSATFQRMITKMFELKLGKTMEAYIDDMIVKSKLEMNHLINLEDALEILAYHRLRLNAEKCAFSVGSGKFLGHIVSCGGIEADLTQIVAMQKLRAPTTIKEVQRLTGMVAALNQFIRRSGDLC